MSVDLKTKLSSQNFYQKNIQINLFLLSWRSGNTWNLIFDFKFQLLPDCQNRKTNSFVFVFGEVLARQFCFEIYWPSVREKSFKVAILWCILINFDQFWRISNKLLPNWYSSSFVVSRFDIFQHAQRSKNHQKKPTECMFRLHSNFFTSWRNRTRLNHNFFHFDKKNVFFRFRAN